MPEDAKHDFEAVELLAKRTKIQEAQRSSPLLRLICKTPEGPMRRAKLRRRP
jgi:hypothetical protein